MCVDKKKMSRFQKKKCRKVEILQFFFGFFPPLLHRVDDPRGSVSRGFFVEESKRREEKDDI